ncbi:unnamed protein product [Paramecium pentaurelia]|uniref:Protein kinase domain-containing protein n=1 Tax=Paramecium pentaurelia TaxID=43138 RepID=A0A8S1VA28_9CILI|nr:unnamed protein product [Paramecium pentaurelia]
MSNLDYTKKLLAEKYVQDLSKFLGSGSFADVHQGYMYRNQNELIAIKSIDKRRLEKKKSLQKIIINYVNREKLNQQQLSSPHIVKMIDFIENDEAFYFILEYCDQGNLQNKLKSHLPQNEIFSIFEQIVQGYKEIRDKKIIHRDLKPENILFSKGVAKIGDFGFSKLLDELDLSLPQSTLGTPLYIAPEVTTGKYSSKADVWSLGVILYRMLYGKAPMEMIQNNISRASNVYQIHYPQHIEVPPKYFNLLQQMLTADPEQRIGWDQIFKVILGIGLQLKSQQSSQLQEIQEILQDQNNKVKGILNYFLYIQDILKFIRQLMRDVQEINQIIQLSQEQQLNYSVITQKYMLNELAFYFNVLQGQNMLFIQILPNDFQIFKKSENYEQTFQSFQQNYSYLIESYNQVKIKYDYYQKSSLRTSENTNYVLKQSQFKLPNYYSVLQGNQNDQAFGEIFNQIYHNIIEHIRSKLNIQAIQIQQKQSLLKVLIKLIYCLQPLQFSHLIFEPQNIEQKLRNSSALEQEFNNIYAKYVNLEI